MTDHVVVDAKAQVVRCNNCGGTYPLNKTYGPTKDCVEKLQAFSTLHRDCEPEVCPVCYEPDCTSSHK